MIEKNKEKDTSFKVYSNQRWSFVTYQEQEVDAVMAHFQLPSPTLARVLIANAQTADIDAIETILNPDESLLTQTDGLCAPHHLTAAVDRIRQAMAKKEVVVVNGDPDADGISGTSILVAGLRQLGLKTAYRFPVRPVEGHGIQVRIIDEAKAMGSTLVISTDCGTKDTQVVDYANENGVDVIITDHHILGHQLPKAVAVINPFTVPEKDVFKNISGAAVAFKFMQAVYKVLAIDFPDFLYEFSLITAAFGSISDRVSMKDPLNRLIVQRGVSLFFKTEREGLKALRDVSQLTHSTGKPRHLSRTIIPRLNAPGRIGNPAENIPDSSLVVDLLLLGKGKRNKSKASALSKLIETVFQSDDAKEPKQEGDVDALSTATDVDVVNEKRKQLNAQIDDEIDKIIDKQVNPDADRVIIVEGKDWNSGVIGIVADRLKERFLRPAIILNNSSESPFVRGSVRSIPRIDIYREIDAVEQQFEGQTARRLFECDAEVLGKKTRVNAFGGHSQACGFTIHRDDVALFKSLLRQQAEQLSADQFEYHYDVVDVLDLTQVSTRFIDQLDRFSPYGKLFDFPIFHVQGCYLKGGRVFGNRYQQSLRKHVNFIVAQSRTEKALSFEAVGFGLWKKFTAIREQVGRDSRVDLICTVELDPRSAQKRNRRPKLRLNVLDIRLPGAQDGIY